jgi:allophanate hydrolase subunit 2
VFQGATNKIAMSTCVVVCSSLLLLSKIDAVTRCDHKNVWQETYVCTKEKNRMVYRLKMLVKTCHELGSQKSDVEVC